MEYSRWHFSSIDSTNRWAISHTHLFDPTKVTLVTADTQTEGKGRFQRCWISPPHQQNVYASFCFFVPKNQQYLGNSSQVMAVVASKALESLGFSLRLKWPNDLLLSEKKVGGILSETCITSKHVCVVIGIGINVNMPQHMLATIDQPATSLLLEGGRALEVNELIKKLCDQFAHSLPVFLTGGFSSFLTDYKKKLIHSPGQQLLFSKMKTAGFFDSIAEDGSLYLRFESGEMKRFLTGDIQIP